MTSANGKCNNSGFVTLWFILKKSGYHNFFLEINKESGSPTWAVLRLVLDLVILTILEFKKVSCRPKIQESVSGHYLALTVPQGNSASTPALLQAAKDSIPNPPYTSIVFNCNSNNNKKTKTLTPYNLKQVRTYCRIRIGT